jgi:hypothetical protein
MTTTISLATANLMEYLKSIGGSDVHEFVDDKGEPDPLAARRLAECLRSRHAAEIGHVFTVTQSANRVVVTLVEEHAIPRSVRRR